MLATLSAVPHSARGANVTVTAGKAALDETPVTVALPGDWPAEGPLRLVEADTNRTVPAQRDQLNGNNALTWIVDSLAAGQSKRYRLDQAADGLQPAKGLQPANANSTGAVLETTDQGLNVNIDGKLFTTYQIKNGPKPYLWPVIGPTGHPVTRAFPMKRGIKGEVYDHPHHRSFWFTHGRVNGENFWLEAPTAGKTIHTAFRQQRSGPVFAEFTSEVDWIGRKGDKVCADVRRFRFYATKRCRLFDNEIRVLAGDREVVFGDDKEGTFGFRVAGTMSVKQGPGRPKGTLINAEGLKDVAVWGKRSKWCDYFGPVEGQVVGIAIFDHPTNLRHPTYWHARDYGLFCANPFGLSFFVDKKQDGTFKIAPKAEWRQLYRLYLHHGSAAEAKVDDHYVAWVDPPTVSLD